jgi:hypothetical protein
VNQSSLGINLGIPYFSQRNSGTDDEKRAADTVRLSGKNAAEP